MTNKLSTERAIEALYTVRAYYASLTAGYPKGKDRRGIGDVMCSEIANSCLMAIQALEQESNRCDSCVHSEEQDGSNCYECVKGMADNFETQPTDADCISRQMVNELVDELARAISDERCCISRGRSTATIMQDILNLPSVTQTRPKGKWKILDECANEGVYCSKCHKTVFKLEFSHTMKWRNFKYCPNCGARMEVEK